MKNKIILLFTIALLYFSVSCTNDNKGIVYYENFPNEINLTGEIINIDDTIMHNYPLLTIIEDKLVILDYATDDNDYYYHVYDTINFSYKYSFCRKGRGPLEAMYCSSLTNKGNSLYVDNGLKRNQLREYRIGNDSAEITGNIELPNTDSFVTFNFTVKEDNSVWALTSFGGNSRAYHINPMGAFIDSAYTIPENSTWSYSQHKNQWNSELGYCLSKDKLILATNFGERLDILNTINKEHIVIIGPGGDPLTKEAIDPQLEIQGFIKLQITDNYIYALYSGQKSRDVIWKQIEEKFSINVYTLDGVPVIKLS